MTYINKQNCLILITIIGILLITSNNQINGNLIRTSGGISKNDIIGSPESKRYLNKRLGKKKSFKRKWKQIKI